jgi:hypothetical protein
MRLITKPIVDLPCSRIVCRFHSTPLALFFCCSALPALPPQLAPLLLYAIYFTTLPEVNLITPRRHGKSDMMIIGCHFFVVMRLQQSQRILLITFLARLINVLVPFARLVVSWMNEMKMRKMSVFLPLHFILTHFSWTKIWMLVSSPGLWIILKIKHQRLHVCRLFRQKVSRLKRQLRVSATIEALWHHSQLISFAVCCLRWCGAVSITTVARRKCSRCLDFIYDIFLLPFPLLVALTCLHAHAYALCETKKNCLSAKHELIIPCPSNLITLSFIQKVFSRILC